MQTNNDRSGSAFRKAATGDLAMEDCLGDPPWLVEILPATDTLGL